MEIAVLFFMTENKKMALKIELFLASSFKLLPRGNIVFDAFLTKNLIFAFRNKLLSAKI